METIKVETVMKKKMIYIIGGIIAVGITFVGLGFILSKGLQVNYHELDKGFELKIAQISDTHFDENYNKEDFIKLVETINSEELDVLLFTGDLFQVHEINEDLELKVTELLSELKSETKIAVLGNHDYYPGQEFADQVIRILENSGFIVLFNEIHEVTINNEIFHFVGLDDLMMGDANYQTVLESIDSSKNTFIVGHEPDSFIDIKQYDFITMFSGHSHGGQVRLPFIGDIINVPGAKVYNEHHYNENGKDLFVSFGLGESMIRIRFFNKRQFEIYTYS